MAKKKKGKGEGRLEELECMLMLGEKPDREEWEDDMRLLAEKYPDEFGYLLEELDRPCSED